jgi:TonB family protein
VLFLAGSLSQTAIAQSAESPRDQIEKLIAETSLDRPGVSPWHLHLSFSLFNLKGKHQEDGTIEEWWVSPGSFRIVIASPSYNSTVPAGPESTGHYDRESYLTHELLTEVVHPVPNFGRLDALDLSSTQHAIQGINLSCLGISRANYRFAVPETELCTERDSGVFRIEYGTALLTVTRNNTIRFMSKSLAFDNAIAYGGQVAIQGHVDTLEAYDPTQSPVALTTAPPSAVSLPSAVVAGHILTHEQPVYPPGAKMAHIAGTVVLCGTISKEGKIASLDVVTSPDQSLSKSAMDAVRNWTYTPYLLNGEPTEVDSTFTVNYNFH